MKTLITVIALCVASTVMAAPAKDPCRQAAEARNAIHEHVKDNMTMLLDLDHDVLKIYERECGRKITAPQIGMTYDQAALSTDWGLPREMTKKTTKNGVEVIWTMDRGLLLFTDGALASIIEHK